MLETSLLGIKLKSPIMLGSGTLGERKESVIKALDYGAGAVVTRSLRVQCNRKPFFPAYYISKEYMLNADNSNRTPYNYWVDNSKEVESHGPLAISLSSRNPEDCLKIVSEFENNTPPSYYELNFSCSHSAKLYGRISYEQVRLSLELIKSVTKKPIFLKLSLDNIDYAELAELEGLFDAYVLSNTIGPGLKIDVVKRKPSLGSTFGGVSGAAIKPLVLAKIYDLIQKTKKPIIGVGGIESAEDVLEYIILGCRAVQVYTLAHRDGLQVFNKLNSDLESLLSEMSEDIHSIRGTLWEKAEIRS